MAEIFGPSVKAVLCAVRGRRGLDWAEIKPKIGRKSWSKARVAQ